MPKEKTKNPFADSPANKRRAKESSKRKSEDVFKQAEGSGRRLSGNDSPTKYRGKEEGESGARGEARRETSALPPIKEEKPALKGAKPQEAASAGNKPGNHHDRLFKAGYSDNIQAAKELLSLFLFPKEAAACDWDTLRPEKDSFQDLRADLLFSVGFKGDSSRRIRFCLLLEHKSQFSRKIFLQILKYMIGVINKSFEETGEAWPVYSFVLYHGEIPYKWGNSLKKGLWGRILGKIPSSLRKGMLDCEIRVLDIRDVKVRRAIRDKNFKSRGFLNMLREVWSFRPHAEELKKALALFKNWPGDREDLALSAGEYLQAAVPGMTEELWRELDQFAFEQGVFPKGGYMNTKEYFRERFREEGRQEGMRQGMQKRDKEVICNMLREKADISFISKVTGLPEAEIIKLQSKEGI